MVENRKTRARFQPSALPSSTCGKSRHEGGAGLVGRAQRRAAIYLTGRGKKAGTHGKDAVGG